MTARHETHLRRDGRTKAARFLKSVRAALVTHVGGAPTTVERQLIERAAMVALRLQQLDDEIVSGAGMTESASKSYIGWVNAYRRILAQLGVKQAAPPRGPTLTEALAQGRAAREAAAA